MRVETPDNNYRGRMILTLLLISTIASLSIICVIAADKYLRERDEKTSSRGVWRFAEVSAYQRPDGTLYNFYHGYGYVPPCTPMPVRHFPSYGHTSTKAWTRESIQVYINGQWVPDPPDAFADVP